MAGWAVSDCVILEMRKHSLVDSIALDLMVTLSYCRIVVSSCRHVVTSSRLLSAVDVCSGSKKKV